MTSTSTHQISEQVIPQHRYLPTIRVQRFTQVQCVSVERVSVTNLSETQASQALSGCTLLWMSGKPTFTNMGDRQLRAMYNTKFHLFLEANERWD